MPKQLFVSYAQEDHAFAANLRTALEAKGVSCWFAPRDVVAGVAWDEAIIDGIEGSSALLLVLSHHANASPHVATEVNRAFSNGKPILTVRAEDVLPSKALSYYTSRWQWVDGFPNLRSDAIDALVATLGTGLAAVVADHPQPTVAVPAPPAVRIIGAVKRHAAEFFRGRVAEMRCLHQCLEDSEFRLAVICGRGGAGKTALVTRLLVEVEKNPSSLGLAIVFVALNHPESRSLAFVIDQITQVLPPETSADLTDAWRRSTSLDDKLALILRRTLVSTRLLLVLDNFEDILGADDRIADSHRDLECFIAACVEYDHGLRVLVTSRRGFLLPPDVEAHAGRRRLELSLDEGLPPDDSIGLLRDLDVSGSCRLKAALDEQLREIATACFGIPRTLEVVAAHLRAKPSLRLQRFIESPEHLARLVEDPARVLFESLSPSERQVMEVMAVFERPVSAEAVSALAPDKFVDETLDLLLRHHAVGFDSERFILHALDQQYVYRQLHIAAATRLHAAAADYLLSQCKPRSQWKTLADLEPQVTAFEHLFRAARFDDACRLLNDIDREFLAVWGHRAMVVGWRNRLEGRLSDDLLTSFNKGNLGANYIEMGEIQRSADCLRAALEIARFLGNRALECRWQGNLAISVRALGSEAEGRQLLEQSLQLAIDIDDKLHVGRWTYKVGEILANVDQEAAIAKWKTALEATRAAKDRRFENFCLSDLGKTLHKLERYAEALPYLREAVNVARDIGRRSAALDDLAVLAETQRSLNDLQAVIATYTEAVDDARHLGDKAAEGTVLTRLAVALKAAGDLQRSSHAYDQANQIASDVREHTNSVRFLSELADLNIALDRPDQALLNIEQALHVASLLDDQRTSLQLMISAGVAAEMCSDFRGAADFHGRARALAKELGDHSQEAIALFNWADANHFSGNTEVAESGYTQALEMGNETVDTKCMLGLAVLHAQRGEDLDAKAMFLRCAEMCRHRLETSKSAYPSYTLALALLGSGDLASSVAAFERALEIDGSLQAVQFAIQDVELVQRGLPSIPGMDLVLQLLGQARRSTTR